MTKKNWISPSCFLNKNISIGEELGQGAYGRVFKALNQNDGTFLAIKIIQVPEFEKQEHADKYMKKLEKEIALLKHLKHENIVQYIDSCNAGNLEV